jgi:hypothetical protein
MSNLIVMPGSKEFEETLAKVSKKPKSSKSKQPVDLIGRTLMLNSALIKVFQCGGFSLGPAHPVGIVDYRAQQGPIQRALDEGKLVDVTGKDMTKGIKGKGGQTTAVSEEDTGKRVFVATNKRGDLFIATPRNDKERAKFETQLRKKGKLTGIDFTKDATGIFGGITEEVVESSLPTEKTKTKKKAKKNVRTPRTAGHSVRSRN